MGGVLERQTGKGLGMGGNWLPSDLKMMHSVLYNKYVHSTG